MFFAIQPVFEALGQDIELMSAEDFGKLINLSAGDLGAVACQASRQAVEAWQVDQGRACCQQVADGVNQPMLPVDFTLTHV